MPLIPNNIILQHFYLLIKNMMKKKLIGDGLLHLNTKLTEI